IKDGGQIYRELIKIYPLDLFDHLFNPPYGTVCGIIAQSPDYSTGWVNGLKAFSCRINTKLLNLQFEFK
ncbi:MAG: hypothetical protein AAB154_09515, partial [Candidatus Binatota bacterium]